MHINLSEKLAMQLYGKKDPILVMSQIMFKRVFSTIWPPPAEGETYNDPISELPILIDNNTPHDRIDIIEPEPATEPLQPSQILNPSKRVKGDLPPRKRRTNGN